MNCLGRVHTKLTKQKYKRNSAFCDIHAAILNIYEHFCFFVLSFFLSLSQLYWVPSPVGRSKGFCFVASFATCRLVSAYCGPFAVCRGHEFNTSKVEYGRDVLVNIVRLHSVGRTQKRLFFLYIFLMRGIKSQLQPCMYHRLLLHSTWRATRCINITSADCWLWTGQSTEISRKRLRFVGCVCVWTGVSLFFLFCFHSVSVLFLFCFVLFLFCFCSVSVLFLLCFYSISVLFLFCFYSVSALLLFCFYSVFVLLLLSFCSVSILFFFCFCSASALFLSCLYSVSVVFLFCFFSVSVSLAWTRPYPAITQQETLGRRWGAEVNLKFSLCCSSNCGFVHKH